MLPKNGRVAIIDNNYEEVRDLLNDLSKNQIAYRFYHYEGDPDALPDEDSSRDNDFRILIMDLHLLAGVEDIDDKTLISSLIPVLNKIIPSTNYPYVFAYWSKHEEEHKDLIENQLFKLDHLTHKQPIAFVSLNKSKYFTKSVDDQGSAIPTGTPIKIFEDICSKLEKLPAYKTLLHWENIIHNSADNTIQEIFRFEDDIGKDWSTNAFDLLARFSKANLGPKKFKSSDSATQYKSAVSVLGTIFFDTCDTKIYQEISGVEKLDTVKENKKLNTSNVNTKLLLDLQITDHHEPGTVYKLYGCNISGFTSSQFDEESIRNFHKKEIDNLKTSLEKTIFIDQCKNKAIAASYLVQVCVDAICDFTNKKVRYSRFVEGALISTESKEYFFDNEATFKSPSFIFESKEYFLLLNNQFFSTQKIEHSKPIFRLRELMLAEVQSKLARHISRQGMLYL